jgi:integrase/recombinase XerD
MTQQRRMMLEELQRRNYSQRTAEAYLRAVTEFAKHFHRAPDQLNQDHIREYQAYLFRERKLSSSTVSQHVAALRFFYVKTLKRSYLPDEIPFPKQRRRLPIIFSQEEVARLIDFAANPLHRAVLMTLYSTGIRRGELVKLKVGDIDTQRMVIHVYQGKGNRDREVQLSKTLLEELRRYWRWMRPQTYLFPGYEDYCRTDTPISAKAVWHACRQAAKRAGIVKKLSPHSLRHSYATHQLEAGADLASVQNLLGHADVRDTMIYLHLSKRHLQCAPNPLDALALAAPSFTKRAQRLMK